MVSDIESYDAFYKNLIEKLKTISKFYNKKVVICMHPSEDIKLKKKIFSGFLVKKYETKKYIYQSKLVLFFESSAITDAVMLKKKIITLFSNVLDENQISHNMHYVNEIKIPSINIDESLTFDQNDKDKFEYNKKYEDIIKKNYIKKYIENLTKNPGYIKITNIIKKNYFFK